MLIGAARMGRDMANPCDEPLRPFPEPVWGDTSIGRTLAPAQPYWHRRHEYEARVVVADTALIVYEVEWDDAHPCPLRTLNEPDREQLEKLESRAHPHYHGYKHGGRDWVITNETSVESIFVSSLTAHPIVDRDYFQCSGRYRVDSTALTRILGLTPPLLPILFSSPPLPLVLGFAITL
jgi:hypothetical protein